MFPKETKILIIDDMIAMRKLVRKTLMDMEFTVITESSDGSLGWNELQKAVESNSPFQLVISDWNMPTLSGLELLKRVRADDKFKMLPFVLLTAEAEMPQVVEAIKSGVTTYITKPFSPATFQTKLKNAWDKRPK